VKIIVDADGCPKGVLQSCLQQGKQRQIQVWTVANYHHQIESDHHITVDGASQEADMKVVNMTDKEDLVVTQDWGLAALILGKGARCLHPSGREYQNNTIDFMLEERDLKARLRRGGGRTKGPARRTAEEDQRFQASLIRVLEDNQ
jgi:uncharacterized protein